MTYVPVPLTVRHLPHFLEEAIAIVQNETYTVGILVTDFAFVLTSLSWHALF